MRKKNKIFKVSYGTGSSEGHLFVVANTFSEVERNFYSFMRKTNPKRINEQIKVIEFVGVAV